MADNADAVEEIARRLAAHTVRWKCNQHNCSAADHTAATCNHPHHPRDADYLKTCLAMLGLPSTVPDVSEDDRRALRRQ